MNFTDIFKTVSTKKYQIKSAEIQDIGDFEVIDQFREKMKTNLPYEFKIRKLVYDVKGPEREGLTVEDLLEKFKSGTGKALDNDRMLLS